MKSGIVDAFVDNHDRARDFYTAMLGLQVKSMPPTARTDAG
jgi:catechol 2,3-dioxygenase-like lactoylglutathione lyase family enzyme